MKTRKGIEPYIIEELTISLYASCVAFDKIVATDIPVMVTYNYTPGAAARGMFGAMEDAEEEIPAELVATSIRTELSVWSESEGGIQLLLPGGIDLLTTLNDHEVIAIEEEVLKRMEETIHG